MLKMHKGLFGITEYYVIRTHSFYWCVLYIVPNCFPPLIKVKEDLDRTLRYPLNDLHSAKQKVFINILLCKKPDSCIEFKQVMNLTTLGWNVILKSVGVCQRSWEDLWYAPLSRGSMWSVCNVIQQRQSHRLVHLYQSFHIGGREHLMWWRWPTETASFTGLDLCYFKQRPGISINS